MRWSGVVAAAALALVVGGCAPAPDGDGRADGDDHTVSGPGDAPPGEAVELPAVRVDGREVVLETDAGSRVLAVVDEGDGQPVHATLRPGDDDHTVLVLTRVEGNLEGAGADADGAGSGDGSAVRYELRYLVATGDEVSELYWFPWRLQVDEAAAAVVDVAPTPVWAPDGSTLAWIEWSEEGTRLRTVGWVDDGTSRNPSDAAASYPLDDVPAGVQLHAWERAPDGDGDGVLLGSQDGQPYRIELEDGDAAPDRVLTSGR